MTERGPKPESIQPPETSNDSELESQWREKYQGESLENLRARLDKINEELKRAGGGSELRVPLEREAQVIEEALHRKDADTIMSIKEKRKNSVDFANQETGKLVETMNDRLTGQVLEAAKAKKEAPDEGDLQASKQQFEQSRQAVQDLLTELLSADRVKKRPFKNLQPGELDQLRNELAEQCRVKTDQGAVFTTGKLLSSDLKNYLQGSSAEDSDNLKAGKEKIYGWLYENEKISRKVVSPTDEFKDLTDKLDTDGQKYFDHYSANDKAEREFTKLKAAFDPYVVQLGLTKGRRTEQQQKLNTESIPDNIGTRAEERIRATDIKQEFSESAAKYLSEQLQSAAEEKVHDWAGERQKRAKADEIKVDIYDIRNICKRLTG